MSDVLSPTGDIPAIRPQTQMAKGDFHFRISEFGKLISLRSVGSDFAYPEASLALLLRGRPFHGTEIRQVGFWSIFNQGTRIRLCKGDT